MGGRNYSTVQRKRDQPLGVQRPRAIRKMFTDEFATAEMVCMVDHMFEDGQWAIREWNDPLGLRAAVSFRW